MTRYERERARRLVVIGGRRFLRYATPVEAARECDAAFLDMVDGMRVAFREMLKALRR